MERGFKMTEKILRVNVQTSGNALLIDTCNNFNNMNVPTIQPVTIDEQGKLKYRSKGGLIGIYTEKALDRIIAELESLRSHVRKYEASAKEEEASAGIDDKAMQQALKTLISIGHSEEEAKKILKLDEKQEEEAADLPEDLRVTLQVLLDRGIPRQEAYRKLGLTKEGKVDKRKKRVKK
jgi:hypothetical protein